MTQPHRIPRRQPDDPGVLPFPQPRRRPLREAELLWPGDETAARAAENRLIRDAALPAATFLLGLALGLLVAL